MVLRAMHGDVRRVAQAINGLAVVGDGPAMAGYIDVTDACGEVRIGGADAARHGALARVGDPANTRLPEVVPAGPGEVTEHVRVSFHEPPEHIDMAGEG